MTDRELELKIRAAVEHAAPDNLENILPLCGEQRPAQTEEQKKTMPLWSSMQTLYGGMALGAGFRSSNSLIILDVNPSLYLEVDGDEVIIRAEALNDDAAALLEGLDLRGVSLEEAVDAVIEAMFEAGFLSDVQNSILISVENNDVAKENELQEKVSRMIESVMKETLGDSEDAASVISQSIDEDDEELAELAGEYDISMGKAEYIRKLVSDSENESKTENGNNTDHGSDSEDTDDADDVQPLTFEDLAPMTVNDITLVAESRDIKDSSITAIGRASDRGFIGLAEALNAAMAYAGVDDPMVGKKKVSLDCHKGLMVYEVKLKTSVGTFKYSLNAWTGAMVECRKGGIRGEYTPKAVQAAAQPAQDNTVPPRSPYTVISQTAPVSGGPADTHADITQERNNDMNMRYDTYNTNAYNGTQPEYIMPEGVIGEQAAKEAALAHAGLKESDCLYIYCHPEVDHGRAEHYDVKFVAGPYKYKYAIDIFDGSVLGRAVKDKRNKTGYVYEGNYHEHYAYPQGTSAYDPVPGPAAQIQSSAVPQSAQAQPGQAAAQQAQNMQAAPAYQPQTGAMITEDQALDIALRNAGLTLGGIERYKIKIRTKYGRTVYRVKLKVRGFEYEYDVDAYSGAVTKAQKEIDY